MRPLKLRYVCLVVLASTLLLCGAACDTQPSSGGAADLQTMLDMADSQRDGMSHDGVDVDISAGVEDMETPSPTDLATPQDASERVVTYVDVTETNLPVASLGGLSMDAVAADFDEDGDLDLVIANEFRRTIFLLNDGEGVFEDASDRFPNTSRDSEDLAVADWDGDGMLDVLIVSEDDKTNELFLQRNQSFIDASDRLPTEGTSNAVAWATLSGETHRTIFVGNNGQNHLWVEDGDGGFVDATDGRLPRRDDVTQDLELGDLDGDGDLDLVVGNEGDNRILLQEDGVFTDAAPGCLPLRGAPEETRDVELGDVDGDGDLDLLFGNVRAFVADADPTNRLLLNNGDGCYTDATTRRWLTRELSTFDADLIDLDGDGDLDIITGNLTPGLSLGADGFRAFRNDGAGFFEEATEAFFGTLPEGKGFDIEAFDANGDGELDLYFASRGAPDRLFLRTSRRR